MLLLLAGLLFLLKSCGSGNNIDGELRNLNEKIREKASAAKDMAVESATTVVDQGKSVMDDANSLVGSVKEGTGNLAAKFASIALPGGAEIQTPQGSFTESIVTYLGSAEEITSDIPKTFAFDRLNFETGSAILTVESAEQVANFAEVLKAFPAVTILLEGHTDNVGNPGGNKTLSQNRANSVQTALVGLGIDGARLKALGFGDEKPVADNSTEEGRAQNRRVSVAVLSK